MEHAPIFLFSFLHHHRVTDNNSGSGLHTVLYCTYSTVLYVQYCTDCFVLYCTVSTYCTVPRSTRLYSVQCEYVLYTSQCARVTLVESEWRWTTKKKNSPLNIRFLLRMFCLLKMLSFGFTRSRT